MNEKKMYAGLPRPKKFEELEYRDDFMFCRTMEDVDLCHDVIECLMQEPVGELTQVQSQREIKITSEGKPIRLDIYSEEPGTVYDAEMQNKNNQSVETMALPKRSRFYQSSIDNDHMVKRECISCCRSARLSLSALLIPLGRELGNTPSGKDAMRCLSWNWEMERRNISLTVLTEEMIYRRVSSDSMNMWKRECRQMI